MHPSDRRLPAGRVPAVQYMLLATAITLMLTGDVMLGRGVDQIQRHHVDPRIYEDYLKSAEEYVALAERKNGPIPRNVPPDYVWGDVLPTIHADVRIVNLESAVTTANDPWPHKGINYRMHPENVNILTSAHIDCAALSNNHVLDWGRDGLTETLRTLHAAGIKTAGAGENAAEAAAPARIGRLLVFAFGDTSAGVPPDWAALPNRSGINLLPQNVRVTKHPGDIVVVSIHWGANWGYDVPADEERIAHQLIDSGADVVHGHSSHHPKRFEIYHHRLILYGAGDLINDYEGIGGYEEFRPELELIYLPSLAADGTFESMTLIPLRIEKFRLRRASAEETRWLFEREKGLIRGAKLIMRNGLFLASE